LSRPKTLIVGCGSTSWNGRSGAWAGIAPGDAEGPLWATPANIAPGATGSKAPFPDHRGGAPERGGSTLSFGSADEIKAPRNALSFQNGGYVPFDGHLTGTA